MLCKVNLGVSRIFVRGSLVIIFLHCDGEMSVYYSPRMEELQSRNEDLKERVTELKQQQEDLKLQLEEERKNVKHAKEEKVCWCKHGVRDDDGTSL